MEEKQKELGCFSRLLAGRIGNSFRPNHYFELSTIDLAEAGARQAGEKFDDFGVL